jgi:hypothetical protein
VKATEKRKTTFTEFKNIDRNGTYQILGYATVNLMGENINTIKIIQMLYWEIVKRFITLQIQRILNNPSQLCMTKPTKTGNRI